MVIDTLKAEMDLPYDDCISADMCPNTQIYIEETCDSLVEVS